MIRVGFAMIAVAGALSGCGSMNWWSGPVEQTRVPKDAVLYRCDAGKQLAVRYDAGGKSAMIIFPEREFRVDRVGNVADTRYSNGRTTLQVFGEEVRLEEGGNALYDNCKKGS